MRQILFTMGVLLCANFSLGQNNNQVQNQILTQFDYLIPKNASFASWTLYEGDFNNDQTKDYIFSYILSDKNNRQNHAGSGVIIISSDQKKNLKLLGHIPSKTKNIYAFNRYNNKIFYLNEYDAKTNYQSIKSELKYTQKSGKMVRL